MSAVAVAASTIACDSDLGLIKSS